MRLADAAAAGRVLDPPLQRYPDWAARLTVAVAARLRQRGALGRNDCVLFVCDCIAAMTGVDLAEGLRGAYRSRREADRLLRRLAGGGLAELAMATAARLGAIEIAPALASTGDVVMTAVDGRDSLGVVVGRVALVSGRRGVARRAPADCARAWRI